MNQRIDGSTPNTREVISDSDCFSLLLKYAQDNQYAIAVWRLPADPAHHIVISRQIKWLDGHDSLEGLSTGFIFAPFDASSKRAFLKADLSFTFEAGLLRSPNTPLQTDSHTWLYDEMNQSPDKPTNFFPGRIVVQESGKEKFLEVIRKCLEEIEAGRIEKVVPSRVRSFDLHPDFDVVHTFGMLCESNPNALISFVSTPETGTWMGATPELLVSVENKSVFKTVALAGTQHYALGIDLRKVAWTQKDIAEQALVERYIISCFKKIRLREYDEHGPKTVIAGNLLHLKSEFVVDIVETGFPQLGSVMLGLLHPTSAVCGTPLQPSLQFLREHEGYDRQYYAGFLGPVNFENNINIFVNLRCMQLINDQALIYAGAGVTIDSVPEFEWDETEMKMNTLLNVLARR